MFAYTKNAIPSGIIVFYKGAIAAIPSGWHLCDGTNGTDDLRDRFVVGAGDSYDVDDTGGANTHNHTFTGVEHSHQIETGDSIGSGEAYDDSTLGETATGTIDTVDNRPLWFAKAFIQKL